MTLTPVHTSLVQEIEVGQHAGAMKGLAALGKRVPALLVLPVVVALQERKCKLTSEPQVHRIWS